MPTADLTPAEPGPDELAPADATPEVSGRPRRGGQRQPGGDEPLVFPTLPGQAGLATRRQLHDRGWSESAVRHRLADRWQLVYPRVVAPHTGPIDGPVRLVAAALWAGPAAVLTGRAALRLLGLDDSRAVTHASFLVPEGHRTKRHADAQTHRTDRAFTTYRVVDRIPVTTPARCLLDAACWEVLGASDQMALTIAVLQQGLTRPAEIHRELRHSRRNRTLGVSRGVEAFERGAWSRPEAVLGELFDSSAVLPHVCLNPRLAVPGGATLHTPDGYVQAVGLAIQVHSKQFHARDRDWAGTVESDGGLTRVGIVVRGVTPQTLYQSGERFLSDVEQTYLALRGRPLPDVTVESRCC